MSKCARCGRPGPGGLCPTCVAELRAAKARQASEAQEESIPDGLYRSEPQPEPDATVVIDQSSEPRAETRTQPRESFPPNNQPPQQPHQSHAAPHDQIPAAPATKKSKSRAPLIAFLTVLLLGAIGGGIWWFVTQGGFEFAQPRDEQATPANDDSPDAEESEAAKEETSEAAEDEGDDAPEATADGETPNLKQSIDGLGKFFAAAPGDPSAGWEFLSAKRQQDEDWTGFVTHWNSMIGAKVVEDSCSMEEKVLVCDNEYTSTSGEVTVKKAEKTPVVFEGGSVKLDMPAGAAAAPQESPASQETPATEQSPAPAEPTQAGAAVPEPGAAMTELDLEALRAETLKNGAPRGPVMAVLSTKKNGITDETQWASNGTHTFYYADIVALHHELAKRFPNERVYFLQSRDVDDKKSNDLYYTAVDRGFSSKDEAQAWCEGAFPHLEGQALKNECMPRNLR